MGNVTVNRKKLFENIEKALYWYGCDLDLLEARDYDRSEARAAIGIALASLELLRAEAAE